MTLDDALAYADGLWPARTVEDSLDAAIGAAEALASEVRNLRAGRDASARLFRMLASLPCNSYELRYNEFASFYETVEGERKNQPDYYSGVDPDAWARCVATKTIWILQVYPRTPVSFVLFIGDTLEYVCGLCEAWQAEEYGRRFET